MRLLGMLVLAAALMPVQRCDEESRREPGAPSGSPVITAIAPPQAAVGDAITITGSGFAARDNGIRIGTGYHNGVASAGGTTLTFNLPSALSVCPPGTEACIALAIPVVPGTYQVAVVNAAGTSNTRPLQVVSR